MKKAALAWAAAGWKVLPLKAGGKTPLTAHGFKDATTDEAVIAGWWTQWPNANIGIATGAGLIVLDIDTKNGKDGYASLARVGLPPEVLARLNTYTVQTPSGGGHFYFRSTGPAKSRMDILSGIDIRANDAYIVVPPSQIDGKQYEVVAPSADGVPRLAQLAEWEPIAKSLPSEHASFRQQEQEAPPSWEDAQFGEAATPDLIARVRSYLRKCPPAVSGQSGHNRTFRIASILVNGFHLDASTALLLMQEWNQRCEPPWTDKELKHKLLDAALRGPPAGKRLGWLRAQEQNGLVPISEEKPQGEEPEGEEGTETCEGEWCEDEDGAARLLYPPLYVGMTAYWLNMRCAKPYRPFSILSALAIWATLIGRRARFENLAPVVYCGLVAASSNGKDLPLALARTVLEEIGVSPNHLTGRQSSWNAGVESLQRVWFHPVVLASVDEAAGYFGGIALKSDFGLSDFIKASWSRGLGTMEPQARTSKRGSTHLRSIHHPAFSMLMAAQPSALAGSVRSDQLEDGLLPRALWLVRRKFDPIIREDNLRYSHRLEDSPGGLCILLRAREVWNWLEGEDKCFRTMAELEKDQGDEDSDSPPQREIWEHPVEFTAEADANAIFSSFIAATQARIQPAAEGTAPPHGFLWGKAAENAKRVALILAAARCGATGGPYTIKGEEAKWAVDFVELAVRDAVEWARLHMADTPFQRMVNRVGGIIRAAGVAGVSKRDLNRRLRHSYRPAHVEEALQSLKDDGSISIDEVPTRGASKTVYRFIGRRRSK